MVHRGDQVSLGDGFNVATNATFVAEIDGSVDSALQDLDYMHARYCSPVQGRFLSIDPVAESANPRVPQSWNRYVYVWNNPLKYLDPTGEVVNFSGLSESQVDELLKGLNEFTGNTYGLDDNGSLVLLEVGSNSSSIGTSFLDELIASDTVFGVVPTTGRNQFVRTTGNIEINIDSFSGAKYGQVNPQTFNLGSTLVHELYHASSGLVDTLDGTRGGVVRQSHDWTGPIVDFVNQIRAERGLPQRQSYPGKPTIFGSREKVLFGGVNPKKPNKTHYVIRKRF